MGEHVLELNALRSVFGLQNFTRSLKVVRLQTGARSLREVRPSIGHRAALAHARSNGLREASGRLTDLTAEVLHNRIGQGERLGLLDDLLGGELSRDHELGQIAHNFGRGCDLWNVAKEEVGLRVLALDLGPALSKSKLLGLVQQVGELAARDLVFVDVRRTRELTGLEGQVQPAHVLPVRVETCKVVQVDAGVKFSAFHVGHKRAERGLRGEPRQAVDGGVNDVGARLRGSQLRCHTGTRCVVGMHVDGHVRQLFTDLRDEHLGGARCEQTRHVLDRNRMDTHRRQLVG
mmetsp:Transcript_30499/g.64002  ORF Transcript_30499/g.64002 Transcript_30499/m.64002 type:complete len:290 (-) Transcript_30499:2176-3045(-)